jgi:hypothetical protein
MAAVTLSLPLFVSFALLALCTSQVQPVTVAPLQYHFTVRDHGPVGCMAPGVAAMYWSSYASERISSNNSCPIRMDIIDNIYSGHPDFEVVAVYADGCPRASVSNLTMYGAGNTCTYVSGTTNVISGLVEEHLTFGEDGLPKPTYCNGTLRNPTGKKNDARCGWDSGGYVSPSLGSGMAHVA